MCVERGSATNAKWEVERPEGIVDRFESIDIFMLSIETSQDRRKRNGNWEADVETGGRRCCTSVTGVTHARVREWGCDDGRKLV